MESKLILKVKQGEDLSRGFTIKQNGSVMDLSNYTIHFQVKNDPTVKAKSLIDKYITKSNAVSPKNIDGKKIKCPSDINIEGQITDATNGVFQVHLNTKDTSLNPGDYYLIISLETYKNKLNDDGTYMYDDDNNPIMTIDFCDIISSDNCGCAKYIICEQ